MQVPYQLESMDDAGEGDAGRSCGRYVPGVTVTSPIPTTVTVTLPASRMKRQRSSSPLPAPKRARLEEDATHIRALYDARDVFPSVEEIVHLIFSHLPASDLCIIQGMHSLRPFHCDIPSTYPLCTLSNTNSREQVLESPSV